MAQLEALEERRDIALRHARFNSALVASALLNANRSAESEPISPFDFLAGYDSDPEELERSKARKAIKQAVALAFTQMRNQTTESVQAEKVAMIQRMRDNGVDDPEDIIREVFPNL